MVWQLFVMGYFFKADRDNLCNYLVACEYLQIDPTKAYSYEFIDERIECVLSQWNEDDGTDALTSLRSTLNKYIANMNHRRPGAAPPAGFPDHEFKLFEPGTGPHAFRTEMFWNGKVPKNEINEFFAMSASERFAKRCCALAKEGKLKILPGTVNETYVKKELTRNNCDHCMGKEPKWAAQHKMAFK